MLVHLKGLYTDDPVSVIFTYPICLHTKLCSRSFSPLSPSLVLAVGTGLGAVVSGDCGATGIMGDISFGLESLLRIVGGPVGVRAGFWMGGGLEAAEG